VKHILEQRMSKSRTETATELLDSMHQVLPYFDQCDAVLKKRYAPGKWSVREILVHLADTETVLLDRLRRLAAENNPTLMAFDQDKWAGALFYGKRDLGVARQQYESARRSIIEMIRNLKPSVDKRAGMHSEAGRRTFGAVLATVLSHNQHHLKQIQAAAAGRTWKP
jgi:hypothetical protein